MYTVRQPIASDPTLLRQGIIVSRHRCVRRAWMAVDQHGQDLEALPHRCPGECPINDWYVWSEREAEPVTRAGR